MRKQGYFNPATAQTLLQAGKRRHPDDSYGEFPQISSSAYSGAKTTSDECLLILLTKKSSALITFPNGFQKSKSTMQVHFSPNQAVGTKICKNPFLM